MFIFPQHQAIIIKHFNYKASNSNTKPYTLNIEQYEIYCVHYKNISSSSSVGKLYTVRTQDQALLLNSHELRSQTSS